jgi:hypothetical protein
MSYFCGNGDRGPHRYAHGNHRSMSCAVSRCSLIRPQHHGYPISDVATFAPLAGDVRGAAKSRLVCWLKKQFKSSAEPYEQTGEIYVVRSVQPRWILARRGHASPSLRLFGNCKIVMRMCVKRPNPDGRRYQTVCRTRRQDGRLAVPMCTKLLRIRTVRGGHRDNTSVRSHG